MGSGGLFCLDISTFDFLTEEGTCGNVMAGNVYQCAVSSGVATSGGSSGSDPGSSPESDSDSAAGPDARPASGGSGGAEKESMANRWSMGNAEMSLTTTVRVLAGLAACAVLL